MNAHPNETIRETNSPVEGNEKRNDSSLSDREQERRSPRFFLDRRIPGGYQSERSGLDKEAHDAWVAHEHFHLSRDDLIGLSYFHGSLDDGSDGAGPVNGSNDHPTDVVYECERGFLLRTRVSELLSQCDAFMAGYKAAVAVHGMTTPQAK